VLFAELRAAVFAADAAKVRRLRAALDALLGTTPA
jgi:hypothetical protein